MRAFQSLSLPRSLRVAIALSVISTVLVSSIPESGIARTRPPVDMGDPDPTEGTNPSPGGGAKAGGLVPQARFDYEVDPRAETVRSQLREYLLVWRWIIWP